MAIDWTKNIDRIVLEELKSHDSIAFLESHPMEPKPLHQQSRVTKLSAVAATCIWGFSVCSTTGNSEETMFEMSKVDSGIFMIDDEKIDNYDFTSLSFSDTYLDDIASCEDHIKEITEFGSLGDNWDDDGAKVVYENAIRYSTKILASTASAINKLEETYPSTFGTIFLEWKGSMNTKLIAEIGKTKMNYFIVDALGKRLSSSGVLKITRSSLDKLIQIIFEL